MLERLCKGPDSNSKKKFFKRGRLATYCHRSGKLRPDQPFFVFCPTEDEPLVSKILTSNNLSFKINEYRAPYELGTIFCHYKSWKLSSKQRAFLVEVMNQSGWVESLISFLDRNLGFTEVELLNDQYFLHQKAFSILSRKRHTLIKRVFDVCFSLVLLVGTLPITLLAGLFIRLESKGPILYKQTRNGLHDKPFEIMKFRSMRLDAEKNGAKWANQADVRVTRVGKFIRKTRIDELPQLINVLKGEMSLIGPRPEREVFISSLEKSIPYYRFRHAVRPGISGLAQVKYQYGASLEDAVWKHKYDMYYIKHYDIALDLKILFLTVRTVLLGLGW